MIKDTLRKTSNYKKVNLILLLSNVIFVQLVLNSNLREEHKVHQVIKI